MGARKNQKKGAPRRRTSTVSIVKELHKEADKAKEKAAVKQETASIPQPPDCLDDIALEMWNKMITLLTARDQIDEKYQLSIAILCDAYSTWYHANMKIKELRKNGDDVIVEGKKGGSGGMYRNPWFDIKAKSEEKIFKYLSLFGLSPFDDLRIQGTKPGGNKPVESDNPFHNL